MARYRGSVCRICRRENLKLFLKGDRCYSDKCAFDRRGYAPGEHGQRRRGKTSDYGIQLREKQKVKRMYGLLEQQFRLYFERADSSKGITGENLLKLLESRLDNTVYRLGLAPSRNAARQLVRHRHFMVNGRLVDIPSFQVKANDVIRVREKSRQMGMIHNSMKRVRDGKMVPWLVLDKAQMQGTVLETPARQDIPVNVNENLIVELYSK